MFSNELEQHIQLYISQNHNPDFNFRWKRAASFAEVNSRSTFVPDAERKLRDARFRKAKEHLIGCEGEEVFEKLLWKVARNDA